MIRSIEFQWKKIWFLRFSKLYLVTTIAISVLIGAIFSLTTNITQGKVLKELTTLEIIEINILSIDVATIFLIILIAMEIGKEFQNGSIQTYISIIPNRKRYFFSKLLTFLAISTVISIIVGMVSLGNGYLIIKMLNKPFPPVDRVMRFFFGCIFMPITYTILTTCLVIFFESTAGGIVSAILIMFLPSITKIFPEFIQEIFVPIIPATAIHSLAGVAEIGGMEDIGIIFALLTLIIWYGLGCLISMKKFEKNDL